MSTIPKTPKLPAPKSLSKKSEVNSAAHDALLREVWTCAEGIAHYLLPSSEPSPEQVIANAGKEYGEQLITALADARDWLQTCEDPAVKNVLKRLIKELTSQQAASIPDLPEGFQTIKISSRALAAPIRGHRERAPVLYRLRDGRLGAPNHSRLRYSVRFGLQSKNTAWRQGMEAISFWTQ